MPLISGGLLIRGVGVTVPQDQEPYDFGTTSVDMAEPFDMLQNPILVSVTELFDLLGPSGADSVEPFYLGDFVVVDSVETFLLADSTTMFLGTNSPAAPIMGWRDR